MNDDLFDFSQKRPDPKTQKTELRYNREERLKRAPENVKKLHAGEYTKRKGFIKMLFASPASSMLAVAIMLILGFLAVYSKYSPKKNYQDFSLELSSSFTDANDGQKNKSPLQLFTSVTVTPKTENLSGETITVLFFALGDHDVVLAHAEVASIYLGETLTLSVPFELSVNRKRVKKIKAQIQISEKIIVLEKKL